MGLFSKWQLVFVAILVSQIGKVTYSSLLLKPKNENSTWFLQISSDQAMIYSDNAVFS